VLPHSQLNGALEKSDKAFSPAMHGFWYFIHLT
jgi:hypothetical protein